MAFRRVVALAACAMALLGAGAVVAHMTMARQSNGGVDQIQVERARNTATAQAACYSAGGEWQDDSSLSGFPSVAPSGPEVAGSCVSATRVVERRAEAERMQAICQGDSTSPSKAAAIGKSVLGYCLDVYGKIIRGT